MARGPHHREADIALAISEVVDRRNPGAGGPQCRLPRMGAGTGVGVE